MRRTPLSLALGLLAATSAAQAQGGAVAAGSGAGYGIAFASFAPLNTEIFLASGDGSAPVPWLPHPALDYNPSFSRDGAWIVFTSERAGFKDEAMLHPFNPQPYGDLFVMRKDGSDVRMLTDNQFEEGTPSWLPKHPGRPSGGRWEAPKGCAASAR